MKCNITYNIGAICCTSDVSPTNHTAVVAGWLGLVDLPTRSQAYVVLQLIALDLHRSTSAHWNYWGCWVHLTIVDDVANPFGNEGARLKGSYP
jgi:hypothetical protein